LKNSLLLEQISIKTYEYLSRQSINLAVPNEISVRDH